MTFELKDTLNGRLVLDFVLKAHGDFESIQKMLADDPRLVNAVWEMGDGDWESALDAASHMGRADIVRHLIDNGARLDLLYLAAMFDEVELVRAIIAAFPGVQDVNGVHGFPLRHFAQQGNATKVLAYLDELA